MTVPLFRRSVNWAFRPGVPESSRTANGYSSTLDKVELSNAMKEFFLERIIPAYRKISSLEIIFRNNLSSGDNDDRFYLANKFAPSSKMRVPRITILVSE